MANRKTQKKREREKVKKAEKLRLIKMEGAGDLGYGRAQYRVSGGAPVPSGGSIGEQECIFSAPKWN